MADLDTDSDGVYNYQDNCVSRANPDQSDTDNAGAGDGYGDACDGDFGGIANVVDFSDYSVMLGLIGSPGPLGDFNRATSPGVGFADYSIFLGLIGQAPGPSCIAATIDPLLCALNQ